MYGLRLTTGIFVLVVACASSADVSAQVTADDFLPPVLGGPTDIEQPARVSISEDLVEAANAQDAINAAAAENEKELRAGDSPEVGAKMVKFPSGLGFVATGVSVYRTMVNPTATRIAKRKSYVIAFTQAKKNLAEILGGLSSEGKEVIRESLSNINLPQDEMTTISTHSEEALTQVVDMMLRGFVIYEVKDDVAQHTIYVTIVTTPKTRGKLARPAPNIVEVDDLREGLSQVIAEVKSGLVPPVGGRIITMRATGETAFVGFGSSTVRADENTAVQAKLNLSAQKISAARAKDALCGLIVGDRATWRGSVVDSLKDEVREFEPLAEDDPLAASSPTGVRKLEQARQTFVSKLEATDVYRSARQGILPPGVSTKTWFDNDHAWAYGMSVYVPSLTDAAAAAAREMHNARILRLVDDVTRQITDQSRGFTDEEDQGVKRPGDKVKAGPSGKIEEDDDL